MTLDASVFSPQCCSVSSSQDHLFIYSFIYLLPTQEAFVLTDACSGVAAKAQTDFLGIRATAHSKHSGLGKHTRRKSDLWTISCSGQRDFCPYWTKGRVAQGCAHLSLQGTWAVNLSDCNGQDSGYHKISKTKIIQNTGRRQGHGEEITKQDLVSGSWAYGMLTGRVLNIQGTSVGVEV